MLSRLTFHRATALAAAFVVAVAALGADGASGAATTFRTVADPGGGRILTATLGDASLPAATALMLRYVHTSLGVRPRVVQIAQNPSAHTVALLFTAARSGTSYTGLSLITAAPGSQAGGAALYDESSRFRTTVRAMLRRLGAMTSGAGTRAGTPQRIAPAQRLSPHPFSDGTGSIGVPAGWNVTNASGGSASVEGPTGEIVAYNVALGATDPSNANARRYYGGLPQGYARTALAQTVLLPYTGDPVRAWTTAFSARARSNGRTPPVLHVQSSEPMSTSLRLTEITGTGTIPGIPGKADDEPGSYVAFAQVTPPNTMGQWMMYFTFVFVPTRQLAAQGATAAAVLDSVRINYANLNAQTAAIRAMFQRKFEQMMASSVAFNAQLRASTDRFLANQAATEEEMHKQAVGMQNIALDRSVIVDENTGRHIMVTAPGGGPFVYPGSLFHVVPPSELLKGVDY